MGRLKRSTQYSPFLTFLTTSRDIFLSLRMWEFTLFTTALICSYDREFPSSASCANLCEQHCNKRIKLIKIPRTRKEISNNLCNAHKVRGPETLDGATTHYAHRNMKIWPLLRKSVGE